MSEDPARVVTAALARWGLAGATVEFVAGRENQVYRVRSDRGEHALRLKRPGYRSDDELRSELQWLDAMDRAGLAVPRPVASTSGALLEIVDDRRVDLLTWLDGRPMGASRVPLALDDREGVFRALGQQMARLHRASDAWAAPDGFTRCAWDLDGLLGETPVWGRFWAHPLLDVPTRQLLETFRAAAAGALGRLGDGLDRGLIHADLVRENVLVRASGLAMIDFDDGGWGYRLFDVATALLKNLDEPDYPRLEAALLAGYRSVRPLDTARLDLFMALRAVTYVGWIVPRMTEPGAAARSARFIDTARALCRQALASIGHGHAGG